MHPSALVPVSGEKRSFLYVTSSPPFMSRKFPFAKSAISPGSSLQRTMTNSSPLLARS